ncbi:MAG: DUF930 domain-containing protein [Devosia sp.]
MPVPASLLIHLLLIVLFALVSFGRPLAPRMVRPIEVELVTQMEFEDSFEVPPEATVAPLVVPERTQEPDALPPAPADGMTEATQLFANRVLADPQNRQVKEALPSLDSAERIVQLCIIEGLEQLRIAKPGPPPDSISSSAFGQTTLLGLTLDAPDAAYRAARRWYAFHYTCSVEHDFSGVTAYRFAAGDPIPESEWEAHDLIAEDEDE